MSVRTVPTAAAPVASQRLDRVLRAGMGHKEAPTALVNVGQTPGFIMITWANTLGPGADQARLFNSNARGHVLSVPTNMQTAQTVWFTVDDLYLLGLEAYANAAPSNGWVRARATNDIAPGYTFWFYEEDYTEFHPDEATMNDRTPICRRRPAVRYRLLAQLNPTTTSPPPPPPRVLSFMDTAPGI